jgi:hypothetical protein
MLCYVALMLDAYGEPGKYSTCGATTPSRWPTTCASFDGITTNFTRCYTATLYHENQKNQLLMLVHFFIPRANEVLISVMKGLYMLWLSITMLLSNTIDYYWLTSINVSYCRHALFNSRAITNGRHRLLSIRAHYYWLLPSRYKRTASFLRYHLISLSCIMSSMLNCFFGLRRSLLEHNHGISGVKLNICSSFSCNPESMAFKVAYVRETPRSLLQILIRCGKAQPIIILKPFPKFQVSISISWWVMAATDIQTPPVLCK